MRVRLSAAAVRNFDGGSLFQLPDDLDQHGYGLVGRSLVGKVAAARSRADGSCVVEVTDAEAAILYELAADAADAAASDAGWQPSALGDLNACRALMRQIERLS